MIWKLNINTHLNNKTDWLIYLRTVHTEVLKFLH